MTGRRMEKPVEVHEPQEDEQQRQRPDQGQPQQQQHQPVHQPYHQQGPQPQAPPYPHPDHQALNQVYPQAQQQQFRPQYQPQVQSQAQRPYYDQFYQPNGQQQQQPLHPPYEDFLFRQRQHEMQLERLANELEGPAVFTTNDRRYHLIKKVADSSEGTVALARTYAHTLPHPQLRVVKMVARGAPGVATAPREARMLQVAGPHPNIIHMFELAYDLRWGKALMCMEYCSGGDLHTMQEYYRDREVPVPVEVIFQAIINISDALAWIHGGWIRDEVTGEYRKTLDILQQRHIVHRDLNSANVLIKPGENGNLPTFVLGDFGQAFLDTEAACRVGGGTVGFQAPELRNKRRPLPITDKADVYSFGVMIASLCQGLPSLPGFAGLSGLSGLSGINNLSTRPALFKCGGLPSTLRLPLHLQTYNIQAMLRLCVAHQPSCRPEMSPDGIVTWTEGYRTVLASMKGFVNLPPNLRAANVEVAREA